ncbi:hypothetical protein KCP77_08495 [Salmonella enterica subsp. enterica]|nr:hypothetical protein KCP77_08495 [Salmonella enterica subsp. enterica]
MLLLLAYVARITEILSMNREEMHFRDVVKFKRNKHQQHLPNSLRFQSVDDVDFFLYLCYWETLLEKNRQRDAARICIAALYLEQDDGVKVY